MLKAVVQNKDEEGDQPKSHKTYISACKGFLKGEEAGRNIVSD
jgi:hypothetical protein